MTHRSLGAFAAASSIAVETIPPNLKRSLDLGLPCCIRAQARPADSPI